MHLCKMRAPVIICFNGCLNGRRPLKHTHSQINDFSINSWWNNNNNNSHKIHSFSVVSSFFDFVFVLCLCVFVHKRRPNKKRNKTEKIKNLADTSNVRIFVICLNRNSPIQWLDGWLFGLAPIPPKQTATRQTIRKKKPPVHFALCQRQLRPCACVWLCLYLAFFYGRQWIVMKKRHIILCHIWSNKIHYTS